MGESSNRFLMFPVSVARTFSSEIADFSPIYRQIRQDFGPKSRKIRQVFGPKSRKIRQFRVFFFNIYPLPKDFQVLLHFYALTFF